MMNILPIVSYYKVASISLKDFVADLQHTQEGKYILTIKSDVKINSIKINDDYMEFMQIDTQKIRSQVNIKKEENTEQIITEEQHESSSLSPIDWDQFDNSSEKKPKNKTEYQQLENGIRYTTKSINNLCDQITKDIKIIRNNTNLFPFNDMINIAKLTFFPYRDLNLFALKCKQAMHKQLVNRKVETYYFQNIKQNPIDTAMNILHKYDGQRVVFDLTELCLYSLLVWTINFQLKSIIRRMSIQIASPLYDKDPTRPPEEFKKRFLLREIDTYCSSPDIGHIFEPHRDYLIHLVDSFFNELYKWYNYNV